MNTPDSMELGGPFSGHGAADFHSGPVASCAITTSYGFPVMKMDGETCFGCGNVIAERYLLQTNGQSWHNSCLRCNLCALPLEQFPSCFVKDEQAYCKPCYTRQFGIKCARCARIIQATDWVRRARRFVYHLACFACDSCKRQLSTGEEFALQEGRILCKQHYMELMEGDSGKAHQKRKTKRVRTTFTEEQLGVLQANFQVDSNPDGQDLERIAQVTGLSKRVTQVWFQNSRARQKKYQGLKMKSSPNEQGVASSTHSIGPESLTGSEEGSALDHVELDMSPEPASVTETLGDDGPDVYDSNESMMC